MIKKVLLLGNPDLYKMCEPVSTKEDLSSIIEDLRDTLFDFRKKYNAGRAIAAPQIGFFKRLIYMNIDDTPTVFINPVIEFPDDESMEVLDDCMSFPNLFVKVLRYKRCNVKYYDENWKYQEVFLEGDLAELLQHEYDHLDGILATMRAKDDKSFLMKEQE